MATATLDTGADMARKRGRPRVEHSAIGRQVRLDPDLVAKADVAARRSGKKLGTWLSELLEGPVDREYQRVLRELRDEEDD